MVLGKILYLPVIVLAGLDYNFVTHFMLKVFMPIGRNLLNAVFQLFVREQSYVMLKVLKTSEAKYF